MSSIAETAIPCAMFILHDDNVEITEENIQKVLAASNVTVEPIWIKVFMQAFEGKNIGDFLTSFSSSASSGAAPAAAGVAAPADGSSAAAAPAAKKEAPKEESDEEMGMGLFD